MCQAYSRATPNDIKKATVLTDTQSDKNTQFEYSNIANWTICQQKF